MFKFLKRFNCKHKSLAFKEVSEWKILEHNDKIRKEIRYEVYSCLDCGKEVTRPEIRENGKIMQRK